MPKFDYLSAPLVDLPTRGFQVISLCGVHPYLPPVGASMASILCYPAAGTPSPRPSCANEADQTLTAIPPLQRPTSPGIPSILPEERGEGTGSGKHCGFSSLVPTSPPHVRTRLCLPCGSTDALAGVGLFVVPSRRSGPKMLATTGRESVASTASSSQRLR